MSTITKELAKLFRKITNSEIDAEGNAHVVLSPADSLLINNARIALASLEAEAVACIDRANLDYLESGADADVWPASGAGSDDVLLYAAPQLPQPAVLSVSEGVLKSLLPDVEKSEFWFEHNGKIFFEGVRFNNAVFEACRAAMQSFGNSEQLDEVGSWNNHMNTPTAQAGNSPVTPDGWCRACRPVTMSDMRFVVCPECGNKRCPHANDHNNACTGSNEPGQVGSAYPAAPQQEVKSALEHGMQRYAGAMQKLSEGDK